MRSLRQSEIAVDPDSATGPTTAYERARQVLCLGDLARQHGTAAGRLIVHIAKRREREPRTLSDETVAQAVLFRKKYSDE